MLRRWKPQSHRLALRDIGDAIKDLSDGSVAPSPRPGAVEAFQSARRKLLRDRLRLLVRRQFAAARSISRAPAA